MAAAPQVFSFEETFQKSYICLCVVSPCKRKHPIYLIENVGCATRFSCCDTGQSVKKSPSALSRHLQKMVKRDTTGLSL